MGIWTSRLGVILGVAFAAGGLQSQTNADTALIRAWVDTAWDVRFSDMDKSLALAHKILSASSDYYYGRINGVQLIGESHYMHSRLDSAISWYQRALDMSRKHRDVRETANNLTSLATLYADVGLRDSSLAYHHRALEMYEERGDSSSMADALLRIGSVHNSMGHHDEALRAYMASLAISEAIRDHNFIAYNYGSIAIIHDKQGNYEKAEEYFFKALEKFRETGHIHGQLSVYNNLGILYKNKKEYEKSREAYAQTLRLSDSTGYVQGKLSASTNLGILNIEMGFFENAIQHSTIGLQLAGETNQPESMADNLNSIARAHLGLRQYQSALPFAQQALILGEDVKSMEKQRDAHQTLSGIYEGMRAFDLSLHHYKSYATLRDSIGSAEKSKQIQELQTIYETEKKDREIALLAKNAEIDRVRKTRLWIGLILSVLAGGILIYSQWIRRTRDRKILSQEKEIERERRKSAELETEKIGRELDFKKKELAAKALQLARKNEFLQAIHQEVESVRDQAAGNVAESTRKISRRIRMDIESEEDWEQFLASFREVHSDFMEYLQYQYPDITKSELRLACLMKMNLTTKEQASLLNVTPDGIKKARYRLRKKMDLDSDIDIQEHLIALK